MSQWEAWTITTLGMGVVFIGLVACIAFIGLIGRLAQRIGPLTVHGAHGGHGAAPAPAASEPPPSSEPVPADVLAVITAVIALERTLYMNRPGARVTIRRHASAP